MDQVKVGNFLKNLRKEKSITQEKLAEKLNVSTRTISRWENGNNMPDLDLLIELSDFYGVEIGEILSGEKRGGNMDKEVKENVLTVADYAMEDKLDLMKKLHYFSLVGVAAFIIILIIKSLGLSSIKPFSNISDFLNGLTFGIMILAVIYTSKIIIRIRKYKKRRC